MKRWWPNLKGRSFINITETNTRDAAYQRVLKSIYSRLLEIFDSYNVWVWWIMKFSRWNKDAYISNEINLINWERISIWVLWQHNFDVHLYRGKDWLYWLTKFYNDIPLWLKAIPEIVMDIITNKAWTIVYKHQPYLLDDVSQKFDTISKEENNKKSVQNWIKEIYSSIQKFLREKRIKDVDIIVLEPDSKSEICLWRWWGQTLDIWAKWNEDNWISIKITQEGFYAIQPTEKTDDATFLTIEAIPNIVKLLCENRLRWFKYRTIRINQSEATKWNWNEIDWFTKF